MHRWDLYAKGGDGGYASANPHNFRLIFTLDQLTASLRAIILFSPVFHSVFLLDSNKLLSDIHSAYPSDPIASAQIIKLIPSSAIPISDSSDVSNNSSPPSVSILIPSPDVSISSSSCWSILKGLLLLDDQIYVPDFSDLQLRVLHHSHDHILSGYLGQNKTLALI